MPDITAPAQIVKVATMVDGGIRVTFDMPEGSTVQAAQLMECLRLAPVGRFTFEPELQNKSEDNGTVQKGTKRQSGWTPAQEPQSN